MTDPWAWLQHDHAEPDVDVAAHPVSAIVLTDVADEVRPLLAEQTIDVGEVIVADSLGDGAARASGEWLWLFPEVVRPTPTRCGSC